MHLHIENEKLYFEVQCENANLKSAQHRCNYSLQNERSIIQSLQDVNDDKKESNVSYLIFLMHSIKT